MTGSFVGKRIVQKHTIEVLNGDRDVLKNQGCFSVLLLLLLSTFVTEIYIAQGCSMLQMCRVD